MIRAAILSTLLLASTAQAQGLFAYMPQTTSKGVLQVQRPPEAYQGAATFQTATMSPEIANQTCRVATGEAGAMACTAGPFVVLPNPCAFRGDFYADLLCHEQAHHEGWTAGHPRSAKPEVGQ